MLTHAQDVNGHEVIDFIAAFSATNMGQCHPKIVQAVTKTAQQSKLLVKETEEEGMLIIGTQ